MNSHRRDTTYTPGSTNIQFRPVGTTLLITPNINADRTVTLRILQEVSQVDTNGANMLIPTNTGFAPQAVDTVQSRSVSGTVVGKDGLTVAIGGLIEENLTDNRSEVPVLGKLPVIGFFFRSQTSQAVAGRAGDPDPAVRVQHAGRIGVHQPAVDPGPEHPPEALRSQRHDEHVPAARGRCGPTRP